MKRIVYSLFILVSLTSVSFAQNLTNIDFVSFEHEGMIAIKKGDQWGFINSEGDQTINFRNDLVTTPTDHGSYPIFANGRCLIFKKKEGISYFGYIDTTGKTVIEPTYLNAKNFQNGIAIVLFLNRTELTKNAALNKPIVSYDYFEVVIDLRGNIVTYLNTEPTHITLSSQYLRKPALINSKFISNTLIAVMDNQKKWSIVSINKK